MSVGIAIITCDRQIMFEECLNSIKQTHQDKIDHIIVVNDGENTIERDDCFVINNKTNLGVGKSKNIALEKLKSLGCEHLFLVEDDVKFISSETTDTYIELARVAGIKHLNFCLHGTANMYNEQPAPKLIVDYKNTQMALYHNVTGATSYYHIDSINQCGLMDLEYKNAMEHVDHTMRIIKAGMHPPFRWFADVAESNKLISDQDPSLDNSKIRQDNVWKDNFIHGVKRFHELYDINVCGTNQPCDTKEQVIEFLKNKRNEN